jgi:hypothetical protein
MEASHGDWQHMTAEEAVGGDDEAALAVGGEGAAELEATAPVEDPSAVEVIPPVSEAARDGMRGRQTFLGAVDVRNLVPGPDGQMITGRNN